MYIVTGGAGFIGSAIVAALNDRKLGPIVVCDVLGKTNKWQNLNKRFLPFGIISPEELLDFIEHHKDKIKAVIHMGAIAETTETDVDKLIKINVDTTLDIFKWCLHNDKRIIYASSAATYGSGEQGYEDNESIEYLTTLKALNPYGFSKNMADKRIVSMPEKPKGWVGLKFFNVYGPNEYHKGRQKSVVAHAFDQIQSEGLVRLFKSHNKKYEDGKQMRDFIYIKDITRIILWLLDNPDIAGIYNIGSGSARTFNDLAKAVFKAMDKKVNIEYIDTPKEIRSQYQYFTQANMDKLKKVMRQKGIEDTDSVFTSLEDGIADYVRNYLMKEDKYL